MDPHAILLDFHRVLAITLEHALEPRLISQRRHQLEPLCRRGLFDLIRRERPRTFAPHLRRRKRRSLFPNVPRIAQGRLLRRREDPRHGSQVKSSQVK